MVTVYSGIARGNYELLIHYAYTLFRESIKKYDLDSPDLYGLDLVEVEGRKLAYKSIRDFNIFLILRDLISPPTKTVVEIGAGVGELARIFITTDTVERYIIVDIPPALAFSQRLLLECFPEARISVWRADRKRIDLDKDTLCYLLTPDQLDQLPPGLDVGINVASFGEMRRDIVERYIKAVKQKGLSQFVSINQRLRKTNNPDVVGEREYLSYFGSEYSCLRKASFFSNKPILDLAPDQPGEQGYQLLHLKRS